jgi:hypothetical protein
VRERNEGDVRPRGFYAIRKGVTGDRKQASVEAKDGNKKSDDHSHVSPQVSQTDSLGLALWISQTENSIAVMRFNKGSR